MFLLISCHLTKIIETKKCLISLVSVCSEDGSKLAQYVTNEIRKQLKISIQIAQAEQTGLLLTSDFVHHSFKIIIIIPTQLTLSQTLVLHDTLLVELKF